MNILKKTEIKKKKKNTFYLIIGIILFISLWEILSLSINEPNIFFVFFRTVRNTYFILSDGTIYFSILTSLGIALLGIVISFILGVIFGCISGFVKPFEKIFLPFVTFFKIVPTACIIIMLIIFSKSFRQNRQAEHGRAARDRRRGKIFLFGKPVFSLYNRRKWR